ncbi:MAG: hypothetical protein R8K53_04340 [Mariprofundaceae bacterium]
MVGKFIYPLLILVLSACSVMDQPLDPKLVQSLQGQWIQTDGQAKLTVYPDQQVKFIMPDEKPPLRLLSVLEKNKKYGVGFSVGDRWGGPVYIILSPDGTQMMLKFPPDDPRKDDGLVLQFSRAE